jgi:hypothetical protein
VSPERGLKGNVLEGRRTSLCLFEAAPDLLADCMRGPRRATCGRERAANAQKRHNESRRAVSGGIPVAWGCAEGSTWSAVQCVLKEEKRV